MKYFKNLKDRNTFWPEIIVGSIILLFIAFGYYVMHRDSKTHPRVNKVVKIDDKYELSDTLLLCTELYQPNRQYFSTYKQDSLATLKSEDICCHCGNKLSEHHTEEAWLIKQISENN
jgi:hypothetical protein